MPAAATTYPSSSSIPLPKKKPGGAGPAKSAKSFFERAFNTKRFLKTTPVKKVIDVYEYAEDPLGELKKQVKMKITERALFSMVGPSFRAHKIRNVANLITNAPKEIFGWGYYGVWGGDWWYKNWGYEKALQPKIDKRVLDQLLEGKTLDSSGMIVLKDGNGGISRKAIQLDYKRSRFGIPESTTERLLKVGRGEGFKRFAGKALGHLKWGLINPALPLVSFLLSQDTLGYLGWEASPGYFRDKFGRPLKDEQGQLIRKLKVTTKDGREWTLHPHLPGPGDSFSRIRTFTGRGAGVLNAVSGFSRYAYVSRQFFSRNPYIFNNFGWERVYVPGQEQILLRNGGRFAQFNRALSYLHPSNWMFGNETWKRLGWDTVGGAFEKHPIALADKWGAKKFTGVNLIPRAGQNRLANGLHRFARFVYNFHPTTLLNRLREAVGRTRPAQLIRSLRTDARLLRNLGPREYLRLKRLDFSNWASLSNGRLARGYRGLRQSWLGKAGGAVKGWLLVAKKKSDEVWKKLITIPLKFLLDLAMKLLSKLASVIWSKVGPLLSRLSGFISSHIPAGIKGIFSKVGAGIGESVVGKLFAKIGAQLAGKALLGVAARFIGNVLLKGAFEAFAWVTAPEIQILSYAWKGIQWLFGQTIGRVLGSISSKVVASLASRAGMTLAQFGWRALFGTLARTLGTWLATSAWPALTGFVTSTLPGWIAGLSSALSSALAGVSLASLAITVGIATILASLIFIITIYVPALFWNPARSEVTHTQVVLDKVAKVAPGDPATNFIGTNRLPVDNLEHTVEYFFRVRNTADKKAAAVQVTDAKLAKTFPLDGSTIELNPGQELEIGRFAVKIRANSERVETNEAFGTAVIEGETTTFSDVGLLLIGNPAWAPPCGWPATGTLRVLYLDKYPLCPVESECSGIQIVGLPDEVTLMRQSEKVRSTLNGVVSQLWFDRKLGGVMKIKGLDGSFEIVYAYLTEASVKPVSGSLTKYGLEVGSRVTLNQEVAETYFGPLPLSWDSSLHYQVKVLHYGSGVNGFDNKDPLEFTPTRPDRDATVQAGGC